VVIQKRIQERPYVMHEHSSMKGRKSVTAVCPFCNATVVIYLWALAGNGKKMCSCGAALHDDRVARKLVELPRDPDNHRVPGREADGEPGNTSE
jgi:hypothetical protein